MGILEEGQYLFKDDISPSARTMTAKEGAPQGLVVGGKGRAAVPTPTLRTLRPREQLCVEDGPRVPTLQAPGVDIAPVLLQDACDGAIRSVRPYDRELCV